MGSFTKDLIYIFSTYIQCCDQVIYWSITDILVFNSKYIFELSIKVISLITLKCCLYFLIVTSHYLISWIQFIFTAPYSSARLYLSHFKLLMSLALRFVNSSTIFWRYCWPRLTSLFGRYDLPLYIEIFDSIVPF